MKFLKLYENFDISSPVTEKMIKGIIEDVGLIYTSVEHSNFLDIFGVYNGKQIDSHDILWNEIDSASGRFDGLIINVKLDPFKIYTDDLADVLRTPINFMESYGYVYKYFHIRKQWGSMHYFQNDEALIEFIDKSQKGDKHNLTQLAYYFEYPV